MYNVYHYITIVDLAFWFLSRYRWWECFIEVLFALFERVGRIMSKQKSSFQNVQYSIHCHLCIVSPFTVRGKVFKKIYHTMQNIKMAIIFRQKSPNYCANLYYYLLCPWTWKFSKNTIPHYIVQISHFAKPHYAKTYCIYLHCKITTSGQAATSVVLSYLMCSSGNEADFFFAKKQITFLGSRSKDSSPKKSDKKTQQ